MHIMDTTDTSTIKELLSEYKTRPDKSLGQHFLVSRTIVDKIISASDLTKKDTVLEIGPGLGTLTLELSKHAGKVIAIDQDPTMINILSNNLSREKITNVETINKDILNFNPCNLQPATYSLIANLPYQITSSVLWKFLHEEENKPKLMTIMIQREVADRLIAKPGNMSLLSVLAQYYSTPKIVCNVKPGQFFPPPKVHSTVIRLIIEKTDQPKNKESFFGVVRAGFSSKRKTLKNNFKEKLAVRESKIESALQKTGLSNKARAQELSVNDWIKLHKVLYNDGNR